MHGLDRPLPADIGLGPVRPVQHRAAQRLDRGALDQLARQRRHGGVVAVGLVGLQHGELGVVRGVHALVPEVAPDLVDLLDAPDEQPLEVELQRDPQVQVQVVGVDVGGEGPCVRPAVYPLQDGRLDLEEPAVVELFADRPRRCGPDFGHPARLRIDDQVQVALPYPRLRIGEPVVFLGQRAERLGRDREAVRQHRKLAPPRRDHLALDADVVAEINVALPAGEPVLADPVGRDHHLNVPGAVADGGETQLAADPGQHHPADNAYPFASGGVRLQALVAGPHLADRVGTGKAHRVGVGARRKQPLALGQP